MRGRNRETTWQKDTLHIYKRIIMTTCFIIPHFCTNVTNTPKPLFSWSTFSSFNRLQDWSIPTTCMVDIRIPWPLPLPLLWVHPSVVVLSCDRYATVQLQSHQHHSALQYALSWVVGCSATPLASQNHSVCSLMTGRLSCNSASFTASKCVLSHDR